MPMTLADRHAVATLRYYAFHKDWRQSVDRGDPPLLVAMHFAARREARADVRATWNELGCENVRTRPCPSLDDE